MKTSLLSTLFIIILSVSANATERQSGFQDATRNLGVKLGLIADPTKPLEYVNTRWIHSELRPYVSLDYRINSIKEDLRKSDLLKKYNQCSSSCVLRADRLQNELEQLVNQKEYGPSAIEERIASWLNSGLVQKIMLKTANEKPIIVETTLRGDGYILAEGCYLQSKTDGVGCHADQGRDQIDFHFFINLKSGRVSNLKELSRK